MDCVYRQFFSQKIRNPSTWILRGLLGILLLVTELSANSFEDGLEAYQNENYEAAIEAFEMANAESQSAAAYHNLALAYFQLDQPAKAVWLLEKASSLEPFDSNYQFKLSALRQQLGLLSGEPKWYSLAAQTLSGKNWALLASITFWLLIGSLLIPRLIAMQVSLPIKIMRFVSLSICVLSIPAYILNQKERNNGIVIAQEPTNLTAAPANAAPQIGTARPGERAYVIDAYNDFYEITTEAQITGWISKEAFEKLF